MPRITGRLLDITHQSGERRDESGRIVGTYEYDQLHVLDGLEVTVLRVGDNFGPLPDPNTDVDLACRPYAYSSRRNGIQISWTADGPFGAPQANRNGGRRAASPSPATP